MKNKKMSWMDIELKNAIISVLDPTIHNSKKEQILDTVSNLIIKQYKINIKRFKAERKKWMDDNFEENAKILKQPPEY